jgi:hypothetical protein
MFRRRAVLQTAFRRSQLPTDPSFQGSDFVCEIDPWSRWKKLLIKSYSLPVLWTFIKNRVAPSFIRQTTRSHPNGCSLSCAMRATSASSASGFTGPAERKMLNSFIAAAAASRIFRTRSSYFASNSFITSEIMPFLDIENPEDVATQDGPPSTPLTNPPKCPASAISSTVASARAI